MILSGMSTMEQVKDNIATFEKDDPVTPEEEAILLAAAEKMKNSVPCTACRYCCDGCPQGLDIPDLLHKYNQLRAGSGSTIKMQLDAVPKDKWPHACLGCGVRRRSPFPTSWRPLPTSWTSCPHGWRSAASGRRPRRGSGPPADAESNCT